VLAFYAGLVARAAGMGVTLGIEGDVVTMSATSGAEALSAAS
jgi:hypothetical protein